jgi:hypothetical protein
MLLHQKTTLQARGQQRATSLTQVAAFTAARVQLRHITVAAAPPDGACAAVYVQDEVSHAVTSSELEQQRAFLETLPTLPEPGTPDFEFSSENFLQRYEMSEVLGEVRPVCVCIVAVQHMFPALSAQVQSVWQLLKCPCKACAKSAEPLWW